MFLSTAYSRAGQFRNDGSTTFTRRSAAGRPVDYSSASYTPVVAAIATSIE